MIKGQKKATDKNSKMFNFLLTYKFNPIDLQDFIDVFYIDFTKPRKTTAKKILKINILKKNLTPTCRSFILFITNNFDEKRDVQEIIIDKPIEEIIEDVVDFVEHATESEEESEEEEEEEEENDKGNILIHGEDDDGGYIKVDMELWRKRQRKYTHGNFKGKNIPKFTRENLYDSIEYKVLKENNMIPSYTVENLEIEPNPYFEGIHHALKLLYDKFILSSLNQNMN